MFSMKVMYDLNAVIKYKCSFLRYTHQTPLKNIKQKYSRLKILIMPIKIVM